MIIRVKHKSLEAARRHALSVARQTHAEKTEVRLVARRNNSGRFAANGRNFTFEIKPKAIPPTEPPPEPPTEKVRKEIKSLREFFEQFDDADEFDRYDIDGGVDYGEQE